MDLLDFARGPALQTAIAVFAFGVAWRLTALLLLPRIIDRSTTRKGAPPPLVAAIREIVRRSWPQHSLLRSSMFTLVNGYVFHLGLALVVFGGAPHILFISSLIGISWPNLPSALIHAISVVTLAALVVALIRRLTNPVLRLISTFDDYFTWFATALPVLTGLAAVAHLGARYESLLAVHILSVALFLIWLPFGKLMHVFLVFVTRGTTGAFLSHRGAQV